MKSVLICGTYLGVVLVKLHLPALRQLLAGVREQVEERHQVPVVLVPAYTGGSRCHIQYSNVCFVVVLLVASVQNNV